jgi:proteasome lid subunit RPN8/RPN11
MASAAFSAPLVRVGASGPSMADRRLTVAAAAAQAVRRCAEGAYPDECCGALVGRDRVVSAVVALPNTTEEGPRHQFLVRAADYHVAERRARELGGELLGFYHSHPDHPARPSRVDLDHAWPTFAYVIVAVAAGAAGDMTVWHLRDDRSGFDEGSLQYGENSHPDTAQAVHG